MMNRLLDMAGWLVAAALVAAWCVLGGKTSAKDAAGKPVAVADGSTAQVACRPSAAPELVGEEAASNAVTVAAVRESDSARRVKDPKWRPPGDYIHAVRAQMYGCSQQARALADRLCAAYDAKDYPGLLSAAKDAVSSDEPAVRAIAVKALTEMMRISERKLRRENGEGPEAMIAAMLGKPPKPGRPQDDVARRATELKVSAAKTILGFLDDKCDYVRNDAAFWIAASVENIGTEEGIDIAWKAIETHGDLFGKMQMKYFKKEMPSIFKSSDNNPEDYERALRKFAEMAKSADEKAAGLGRAIMQDLLTKGPPGMAAESRRENDDKVTAKEFGIKEESVTKATNPYEGLSDEEALEAAVADHRALYGAAKARFPDDAKAANMYLASSRELAAEARKRFGDTPQATQWLGEELDQAAQRIAGERANPNNGRTDRPYRFYDVISRDHDDDE